MVVSSTPWELPALGVGNGVLKGFACFVLQL